MKIMIADDHPLFAEGLKNLIESQDFNIVGVVNNGEMAVKTALAQKPDVIFMDIDMPIINGVEATRRIKNYLPRVKIIMLTSFEEEDSLFKAIKAGASGYLLKSLDGEELIKSLSDIKAGKNPFSAGLEDFILNKIQGNLDTDDMSGEKKCNLEEVLTERQIDVLKLVVKGLTYRETGEELFLSERTIKYHMEQIKDRLELKTQSQVIAFAKSNVLIED